MALPIDIVFLLQDLAFGGTQRQTLELAKRLDRKRFSPVIWTLSGSTQLDSAAEEARIPVSHLGIAETPTPGFPFPLFGKLLMDRPDILVACTALPNIWGRILGRMAFIPLIVGTCRGGGAPERQHEQYLWRLAHHTICNSMPLYNILTDMGMPSGRLTYISNGVDTDYYEPSPTPMHARSPLILSVGRLVSDKDQVTLLRAFGRVLEQFPQARLRIVGDGPQEFTLRHFIESPQYRGRVQMVPSSTDIRQHYQEARIFALSSVREGQPNVILEAMASALPIVATKAGGVPNLVSDGVTGLLTPISDAVTLGAHLCQLLENTAACEAMGHAGRRLVEREFAFSAMVGTHEKLFERLWAIRQG